jgi:hypothetical protein
MSFIKGATPQMAAIGHPALRGTGASVHNDRFSSRPKGGYQMSQYRVAVLVNGTTINCKLRLVLAHLEASEIYVLFDTLH